MKPFFHYLRAKCGEKDRAEAYQIYVTDSLKVLVGANVRYADIIHKDLTPQEPADENEIKIRLKEKLKCISEDKT